MKVKVGDKIRHYLFSGEVLIGKVEEIQICRESEKSGRSVNSCDVKRHHGVIDLDNGHWCYFYQVKQVIKNRDLMKPILYDPAPSILEIIVKIAWKIWRKTQPER